MDSKNKQEIYIQSKGTVKIQSNKEILLRDLINIYTNVGLQEKIENMIYEITLLENQNNYVASILSIINAIKKHYPDADIHVIGEPDILINLEDSNKKDDRFRLLRVILVCFLLFVGAATAIINFHSDVDMKQTQQIIYRIITGKETDQLLLLQIPYSIGIGVGMTVFFNHIFRKKINQEPSPLEMEVYSYQQNLDQYIKNNADKHNR
ncbi:MAG: stage V sporulation protein AA [Clostridiaceae bacterium]|nr:stage V sporulation protein AA [Clostridiaceae bacterium]